jgi:hypothetical protein
MSPKESKLPAEPATTIDPLEFIVFIEKAANDPFGLGLDVDITDGPTLLIDAVQEGLIQNWNFTHPGSEVKAHHRFLEVNGVRGDAKSIIEEMSRAQVLSIVVRQPVEFSVNVSKPDNQSRLGLELSYCAGGTTLLVMVVNDGLIATWNKEHPESKLEKGDRVVQVNGTMGNSKDLFDMLTSSDSVELKCIKAYTSRIPNSDFSTI